MKNMLSFLLRCLLLAVTALAVSQAAAMEFQLEVYDADTEKRRILDGPITTEKLKSADYLIMKGPIVKGDLDKLIHIGKLIEQPTYLDGLEFFGGGWPPTIVLASPGGDAIEALRMAEVIRGMQAEVKVLSMEGDCASACFFLYLAGITREARGVQNGIKRGKGHLGLHRPYIRTDSEGASMSETAKLQRKTMKQVAAYLADQMVPQRIIDEMMSRSSTDVHWATDEDLRLIGAMLPELEEAHKNREANCIKRAKSSKDRLFCGIFLDAGDDKERQSFLKKLRSGWVPGNPLERYK